MICTCGKLYVGMHETGARNLNVDCPEHGIDSVWWNSEEQVDKREAQNLRLRELQRLAREARKNVGN